mgnify:CR=1 FL=1
MKVSLINPPILDRRGNFTYSVGLPLGLAYIAAYLLNEKIDVQVIDAVGDGLSTRKGFKKKYVIIGMPFESIVNKIHKKTDLIAVSVKYCTQHNIAIMLIAEIRRRFPKTPIVVGGNQCTYHYNDFLDEGVDFVVLGEGERALYDICRYLEKKVKLKDISGVAYRKGRQTIVNKSEFIDDLDSIPFPARHLFPLDKYAREKTGFGPTNNISTSIVSSRGCPYKCSYCTSSIFWGRRWRARSPKNVVDEIEECVVKYGIRELFFIDDNLTLDKERAKEIFRKIIHRGIKITWGATNGVRVENIDDEMIRLMKSSGCIHLTFAPESGSQRVLQEIYNKNVDLEKIRLTIKKCNDAGINTAAYIIIGSLGETEKDALLTCDYIKQLAKAGVDEIGVFPMIPYPESDIARRYEMDKIKPEWEELITGVIPAWYPNYDKVRKLKKRLYIAFYLNQCIHHPGKPFRLLKNFLIGKQETKSDRILRNFMRFLFRHD